MPIVNVFNPSGYAMVTMTVGTGQMKIIAQVNSMNDERVVGQVGCWEFYFRLQN